MENDEKDLLAYELVLTQGPEHFGLALADVFEQWRLDDRRSFSCMNFAVVADAAFGPPSNGAVRRAALTALCLADEESGNGYHNHHHNREVTALTLALLVRHIHSGFEPVINADMAWLTLAAAAVHDYRHDGTSNRIDGVVEPMRLEQMSLDAAKPRLMESGLDEESWMKLSMIVLPTDVNATGLPSPCTQLKNVFAYHASGGGMPLRGIYPMFLTFVQSQELTMCAGILSDADLGVSAGLTRRIAHINALGLERETQGALPATARSFQGFLDNICAGFPASLSGKELLSKGHAGIRQALAIELKDEPLRRFG